MTGNALARMDQGDANRRILAKEEYRADFRRVEAAALKRKTLLRSAEAKRLFARCFYSFQASMYFVSTLGRTKLPHEIVEQIEGDVKKRLEAATKELNKAIDGAELLFQKNGISNPATYDTLPLEEEVSITSAFGRRYFELIHKLDQLMPLLQTLEIEEVINEKRAEHERSQYKRVVLGMSSAARNFAAGIRRRMNEADARKMDPDRPATKPNPSTDSGADTEVSSEGASEADGQLDEPTGDGVLPQADQTEAALEPAAAQ